MKKIFFMIAACLAVFSSCSVDNYDEPDASLFGGIYDAETQELVPTESPNGARVQIYQGDSKQPTNFWCKPDGSFENTRVFAGKYRITVQGPFVVSSVSEQQIDIPASNVKIVVEPYLRITAEAALNGSTLDVDYTVRQSKESVGKVSQVQILYGNTIGLSVTASKKRLTVNTSERPVGETHHVCIADIDTSEPVYVRVAARTSETSYYNYSALQKVK